MTIQIIQEKQNKVIFNPTSREQALLFSYILESNDYQDITVDLIDLEDSLHSSIVSELIGRAIEAQNKGKKILVLTVNYIPVEARSLLNIIKIK